MGEFQRNLDFKITLQWCLSRHIFDIKSGDYAVLVSARFCSLGHRHQRYYPSFDLLEENHHNV